MTAIDVGIVHSTNNGGTVPDYTLLNLANPANETGSLTTLQVMLNATWGSGTGCKIGTFYGSSLSWTHRDHVDVGTVVSGSLQTFSGVECDVDAGDIIGWYAAATGRIIYRSFGGSGILFVSGDKFSGGAVTYAKNDNWDYVLYGEGATAATGNFASVGGIDAGGIASVGGIPKDSIARIVNI